MINLPASDHTFGPVCYDLLFIAMKFKEKYYFCPATTFLWNLQTDDLTKRHQLLTIYYPTKFPYIFRCSHSRHVCVTNGEGFEVKVAESALQMLLGETTT